MIHVEDTNATILEPSIQIISPTTNEVMINDIVPISFELTNFDLKNINGHIHVIIDNVDAGMIGISNSISEYIPPYFQTIGQHTVRFELVNPDHEPFNVSPAEVTFTIDIPEYNWHQKGETINGEYYRAQIGRTIKLSSSGTVLAVSEPNYANNLGRVKIYKLNDVGKWIQKCNDIIGQNNDEANNYSLSLSNDETIIAIGVHRARNDSLAKHGAVRVYDISETVPTMKGLELFGSNIYDYFGHSVAL